MLAGVARARLGDTMAAESWFDQAAKDVDASGDADLTPLLLLSRGELALEHGDRARALAFFRQAAARSDELPDASTVAAAAYRDWLSAAAGKPSPQGLRDAVARAAALKRAGLEGLCRTLQARMQLEAGDAAGALSTLQLNPAVEGGLDPETAAAVQSVRVEVFGKLGETAKADAARAEIRRLMAEVEKGLPEAARGRFAQRPGIVALVRTSGQ